MDLTAAAQRFPLVLLLGSALLPATPFTLRAQTNGTVRFSQNTHFAHEHSDPSSSYHNIVEWVDLRGPAGVTLQVTGGTAQEGVDFILETKILVTSPRNTFNSVVITPLLDGLSEGRETIELTLTNPMGGVVIGSPNQIRIQLEDDPAVKSFSLNSGDYNPLMTVWKHARGATVFVNWHGTMAESAEVDYRTEPGTALPGVDYQPVSSTLRFPNSEGFVDRLVLTIPILTNSAPGGDKEFRILLNNPSAGHVLGDSKEVTVRILNDEAGFALQPPFGTQGVYEVSEIAGEALVDVVIVDDTATRPVQVQYRTEPLSATPTEDYTPVSGTLTFAARETRKTIAIPIINDNRKEGWDSSADGRQRFKLLLENPSGGLWLSRPREVEIPMLDNDIGYAVAGVDITPQLVLDEHPGTVTITVHRQGDFTSPSSVHYRLTTEQPTNLHAYWGVGTATAGKDFLPTGGTLAFGATETNKTFTVTLLDDSLIEGDETFFIELAEATGGVPIATPATRVVIRDSEQNLMRVDPEFKPEWPLSQIGRYASICVVQLDGKILLVTPADRVTGEDGVLVVRLLADGRTDPLWQAP